MRQDGQLRPCVVMPTTAAEAAAAVASTAALAEFRAASRQAAAVVTAELHAAAAAAETSFDFKARRAQRDAAKVLRSCTGNAWSSLAVRSSPPALQHRGWEPPAPCEAGAAAVRSASERVPSYAG